VKLSWKSGKSSRYAAALLGTSVIAATTLAGITPAAPAAFAARTASPPHARSHRPGISIRPDLSLLPGPARHALAPLTTGKDLFGVFCTSADNCWAVGEIKGKKATVNQVLHWTGKRWFPVKVPNQAGTKAGALNELFAVRCVSARDCWAVGDSQRPGSVAQLDQVLHFRGTTWTLADTPAPGGTAGGAFNSLADVACTGARSCWAVGEYGLVAMPMQPEVAFNQVLHWDGTKWTFMKSPDPAGTMMGDVNLLFSVRCTTPTSCWAAGTDGSLANTQNLHNEMLFSNGKKWTTVKVPNPAGTSKLRINLLNTLACTAKPNCWAVGVEGNLGNSKTTKQFEHNQALHWNGQHWVVVKTPDPDKVLDELIGVTCVAAQDCWAVGSAGSRPGLNVAMHWNGAKWSLAPAVNGGGTGMNTVNILESVRCTSHSSCWAVGNSEVNDTNDANQILHWNGTKWVSAP
jgi:hypothetical protein